MKVFITVKTATEPVRQSLSLLFFLTNYTSNQTENQRLKGDKHAFNKYLNSNFTKDALWGFVIQNIFHANLKDI